LGRAQEVGVPVMMVHTDTASAIEICENLPGYTSFHSKAKIQRASEVIEREINFDIIYQQLELSKR
jgi:BioD-like phosphotransacetylase family protein